MQAKALKELLLNTFPNANDFGNEIIPGARDVGMKVQAYAFQVRWRFAVHAASREKQKQIHPTAGASCLQVCENEIIPGARDVSMKVQVHAFQVRWRIAVHLALICRPFSFHIAKYKRCFPL